MDRQLEVGVDVTPRRGPLDGMRVIELATVVMGPYAGQLLGDLGADVIKIETANGDDSRVIAGGDHPELSGLALNLHRNKRSLVLDLKHETGIEVFRRLLAGADVLVTNVRPGALRRLGLDQAEVTASFAKLVYCDAHGFRSDSDECDRPAFDDIIQALTGLPDLVGRVGGEPRFVPVLVADKVAGLTMVCGILAALVERSVTGRGQRVEIPMFDAILAFNLVEHLSGATTAGGQAGYSRALTPARGPHRTSDGWIALMPYSDEHWHRLYEAVGAEHLLANPWHRDMRTRMREADSAYRELKELILRRSTDDWIAIADALDVPAARVVTLDELVTDDAAHRGVIIDEVHPVVGPYRSIRSPYSFSAYAGGLPRPRPTPLVGAHSREILLDLGYSQSQIDDLVTQGVTAERSHRCVL
jgi:crotonobetainyl-CoA:carnitine CoA-transferase CaiB-like acyl-CoA transferase